MDIQQATHKNWVSGDLPIGWLRTFGDAMVNDFECALNKIEPHVRKTFRVEFKYLNGELYIFPNFVTLEIEHSMSLWQRFARKTCVKCGQIYGRPAEQYRYIGMCEDCRG